MASNLFGKISVGITASTGGLTRGLNLATVQLKQFASINKKLAGIGISTGFLAATTAIGLATSAIRKFAGGINYAVQSSASLTEAQNRVDVVFGQSAEAVKRFADSTAAIGIAKSEALDAAGLFGTLFTNIGVTEQRAAQMSNAMVELSANMASYSNKSVEESLRALRSALVGEVEPIRRLGIVLNDSELRQEAFAMGLTKTTRFVLTPAVKMVAAYSSIMKQAGRQHGDFARTSHELTNQQRILTANFKELIAEAGERLKPVFLSVVSAFNNFMPTLRAYATTISQMFTEMTSGFSVSISFADILNATFRTHAGILNVVRGIYQMLAGTVYSFMQTSQEWVASFYENIGAMAEWALKGYLKFITFITTPLRKLISLIAKGLRLIGDKGLANSLELAVKRMRELPNAAEGIGKMLNENLGLEDVSATARRNAERLGKISGEYFADGIENISNPFKDFDRNLLQENLKAAAKGAMAMIPGIGDAVGGAILAVGGAVKASVESLKAITVDSAEGEAFRNALMRGADPRVALDIDRRIADNTGRAANALEGLPGAIAGRLGNTIAAASVSV